MHIFVKIVDFTLRIDKNDTQHVLSIVMRQVCETKNEVVFPQKDCPIGGLRRRSSGKKAQWHLIAQRTKHFGEFLQTFDIYIPYKYSA